MLKWCCRDSCFKIYTINCGSIISKSDRELLFTSASFSAWQLREVVFVRGDNTSVIFLRTSVETGSILVLNLNVQRLLLLCCGKNPEILCYINWSSKLLLEKERKKEGHSIFLCVLGAGWTQVYWPIFYILTTVANVRRGSGYWAVRNSSPRIIFRKS